MMFCLERRTGLSLLLFHLYCNKTVLITLLAQVTRVKRHKEILRGPSSMPKSGIRYACLANPYLIALSYIWIEGN